MTCNTEKIQPVLFVCDECKDLLNSIRSRSQL